jgi:hypothetical protein
MAKRQKKSVQKRPVKAPARDRARSDQEIVRAIQLKITEAGATATEARIRELIDGLRSLKPYGSLSGNRASNQKYAKKIIAWIDEGGQLLADHPEDFNFNVIFAPRGVAVSHPEIPEILYQQAELRYEAMAAFLSDMRGWCEWIIATKFGDHGSSGYQQERCAISSRELLEELQLPIAPTSSTSTYREVASLFFEAMMGVYRADLERACEAMAKAKLNTRTEK